MARYAIFCDGTWNSPSIRETTHVHELFEATGELVSAGPPPMRKTDGQLSVYFDGIGTPGSFATTVGDTLYKYLGGALGWGLNAKIKQAYAWIAQRYRPGDEILIFGFSRGAYTARSLAGMIRKAGFPDKVTSAAVNRAFRLYKQRGDNNGPDTRHIQEARRRLSPNYATSQADKDWRGDDSAIITISYLGVWDTVGALGVPTAIVGALDPVINFRHQFHDTELSSQIQSARHAISLDEQRKFYPPTLWTNLNELARGVGETHTDIKNDRKYQQIWFAGDHGTVGGSGEGEVRSLSAVTLHWILEGALNAGLKLADGIDVPNILPDPALKCSVYAKTDVLESTNARLLAWRDGPHYAFELSPSVEARLTSCEDYRPQSLRRLRPDLF